MTTTMAPQPELTLLEHVAVASWRATKELRSARFHPGSHCPTRSAPYGPADPGGQSVHDTCSLAGCLDLLHELISRVLAKLNATELSAVQDLAAFTFRIAGRELVEVNRAERTRLGFPARPTRDDGVAGRINASLEQSDRLHGHWFVVLFRIMRAYPFSARHVCGRWPLDGLVTERSAALPSEPSSPDIVRREIAHVLGTARSIAGHDWVYTNLILPLNAHGARVEVVDTMASPTPDTETAILCARLRTVFQRYRLAGLTLQAAFTRASLEVTGLPAPLLTPDLADVLRELDSTLTQAA